MEIFSSDSATNTVGRSSQTIDPNQHPNPGLKSIPFKGVIYLENLFRKPAEFTPLQVGINFGPDGQEAVKRLKTALLALDHGNSSFDLPTSLVINPDIGSFDIDLKVAVEQFQSFAGLTVDGIFGANTLGVLDNLLFQADTSGSIYQTSPLSDSLNYIGRWFNSYIEIQSISQSGGTFEYSFYENKVGGEPVKLFSDIPQVVQPVITPDFEIEGGPRIAILPNETMLREISEPQDIYFLEVDDIVLTPIEPLPAQPITLTNLEGTREVIPPKILSDAQVRLYRVKSTDTFSQIVIDNYYGAATEYVDPFDPNQTPYFTAPALSPTPVAERPNDGRFQFYLNLLYYYNCRNAAGEFQEYGMKASSNYTPNDPSDLNDYNIFDNAYDPSEPESLLPNYYRFLRSQQSNGTQIQFDQNGETTTFLPDPDKYIYIPSKRTADALFYHLNFRYFEMLTTPPGADGPEFVDDISGFLDLVQNTSIPGVSTWLLTEIINVFEEVWGFLKQAHNFIVTTFAEYWTRGIGTYFSGAVGLTGAVFTGDLSFESQLWRKMGRHDELTIMLRQEGSIKVGVETGFGGYVGFNLGKGKRRPQTGLVVGGSAGIYAELSTLMDFEFPIRPDETGLISAFVAAIPSAFVKINAEFLDMINLFNISPRHYLTQFEARVAVSAEVWGSAQLSVINGVANDDKMIVKSTDGQSQVEQNKERSFLSLDNIMGKLNGIGVNLDGNFILGTEFHYQFEYDRQCLIPDADGRVPNKASFEFYFTVQGSITTGFVGNLLQKFLLSLTPISTILSFLEFNERLGIIIGFEYDRGSIPARDLTDADVNLTGFTNAGNDVTNANGNMKYEGTGWTAYLKFEAIGGNVDALCGNGHEAAVNIDTFKLYELVKNSITFSASLNDVVAIFKSFSFRFKLGVDDKSFKKVKIVKSLVDQYTSNGGNSLERISKKELIKYGRAKSGKSFGPLGVTFGMAVYISLEFEVADIVEVMKFYIKRHYLINYPQPIDNLENGISKEKERIIKNQGSNLNYSLLYQNLNTYLDTTYAQQLQGASFAVQLCAYLLIFKDFLKYLDPTIGPVDTSTEENQPNPGGTFADLGVAEIMQAMIELSALLNINAGLEMKLGAQASAAFKAQAGVALRIFAALEGALMDNTLLMEDGAVWDLDIDDPVKKIYDNIAPYLNANSRSASSVRKSVERKSNHK